MTNHPKSLRLSLSVMFSFVIKICYKIKEIDK